MQQRTREPGHLFVEAVFFNEDIPPNLDGGVTFDQIAPKASDLALYFVRGDQTLARPVRTVQLCEVKHEDAPVVIGRYTGFTCSRGEGTFGGLPTLQASTGRVWLRFRPTITDLFWLARYWNRGVGESMSSWWTRYRKTAVEDGMAESAVQALDMATRG